MKINHEKFSKNTESHESFQCSIMDVEPIFIRCEIVPGRGPSFRKLRAGLGVEDAEDSNWEAANLVA